VNCGICAAAARAVSDAERQMQDAINAWKNEKSYFFYKNMFDFCADQNCANYMQVSGPRITPYRL